MLKKHIIRKNHEFQDIIGSKKQIVSSNLIFYFRKNGSSGLRIGISVSKKFANAVHRNRQRRQVRAILDSLNKYDLNYDLVIILRKTFLHLKYDEKLKYIDKMLRKLD